MTLTNATEIEAELVAAAREDATAFDALYRRNVTRVYRTCCSRTNNEQVAEDIDGAGEAENFFRIVTPMIRGTHLCTYSIQPPSMEVLAAALWRRIPAHGKLL